VLDHREQERLGESFEEAQVMEGHAGLLVRRSSERPAIVPAGATKEQANEMLLNLLKEAAGSSSSACG
jgi:hypothetical protein